MSLSTLKSDELKRALEGAQRGNLANLEFWLARMSGLPGPRPNLALAEAFGDALLDLEPRAASSIVSRLANHDAAPDTAEVYFPIVAAMALVAQVREARRPREAWAQLLELAADERAPVRVGVVHALAVLAAKRGADRLVEAFEDALGLDDREVRWGSIATLVDGLVEAGLPNLTLRTELLERISSWVTQLADAPRAAERSDARRRGLLSLTAIATLVVQKLHGEPDGAVWLEDECKRAFHPDVRKAYAATIERLQRRGNAERAEVLEPIKAALAASAKPLRDPTLIRHGTRRRGWR